MGSYLVVSIEDGCIVHPYITLYISSDTFNREIERLFSISCLYSHHDIGHLL